MSVFFLFPDIGVYIKQGKMLLEPEKILTNLF